MAIGETILAYDEQELFEWAGNLLFAQAVSPHPFLVADPDKLHGQPDDMLLLALEHLLKFKLEEPERMAPAAKHFRAALDLSRQSWKTILAETDDDFEWIPNPDQHGAIRSLDVTRRRSTPGRRRWPRRTPSWRGRNSCRGRAAPPKDDSGLNLNQSSPSRRRRST